MPTMHTLHHTNASYLLQLVESVDLIDEEYGVSLEHDLLVPSHLDDLFDVLHSGCGGR